MARKKAENSNAPKCMIKGCEGKSQWKGLCSACYGGAKQLIDSGLSTWVELQALGLAEGPPILKEFARLKQLEPNVSGTDPIISLQDILGRSDPDRHKDVRGPECKVSPSGEHAYYKDLRPEECIYCGKKNENSAEELPAGVA